MPYKRDDEALRTAFWVGWTSALDLGFRTQRRSAFQQRLRIYIADATTRSKIRSSDWSCVGNDLRRAAERLKLEHAAKQSGTNVEEEPESAPDARENL